MTINEKISRKIADDLELNIPQVEKAIKSIFDFLVISMEEGDLRPIRMQYLGLWECKPLRIKKLTEKGYFKDGR